MRLLDVGCGIGQYIKTANLLGFDAEGIEISQTAAAIAKQHGLRVTPGDIRNLPFDDDSFDLIVAGGSLEHFRETETALREIHRVMKTEALLLGNVPYRYTLFVLAKFGQQAAGVWKCGYEKSFSVARWKRISEACGLKVHAVEISRYRAGRHRILGGMLELADRGTNLIGLGGHHIFFQASKLT
jgi:SAM-dependent methyltransferase